MKHNSHRPMEQRQDCTFRYEEEEAHSKASRQTHSDVLACVVNDDVLLWHRSSQSTKSCNIDAPNRQDEGKYQNSWL